MKRRTFISLMSVLAAAGVLTLSGCSSNASSSNSNSSSKSESAEAADQLSAIQASGKLIVALEGAWQPWSYHDESDTLVGYDVEVSRAIAEKLGVEPEYVESDWDSLFAGLDAGRYDMVCNGVEVTDERALTYDFTTPYGYIHTALAVKKDNDTIQTFEDLKGKTTANSLASTYMELAESYGATVQGIDTLEETIQLLTAGRIDATLNADVSFYDYLNVHPDADFKIVAQTEEASHVAIPLRKGDASATLLEAINNAIDELRADGTLKELSEKYFGQDISSENYGKLKSALSKNRKSVCADWRTARFFGRAFFFGIIKGEKPLIRASRASKVAGAFLVLFWRTKEYINPSCGNSHRLSAPAGNPHRACSPAVPVLLPGLPPRS